MFVWVSPRQTELPASHPEQICNSPNGRRSLQKWPAQAGVWQRSEYSGRKISLGYYGYCYCGYGSFVWVVVVAEIGKGGRFHTWKCLRCG